MPVCPNEPADDDDAPRRNARGQFKPGTSGNPGGRARERVQARLDAGEYESHRDTWTSALTGIGTTARDKRQSHMFMGKHIPYTDIAHMWLQDAMFAKAIEKPVQECLAEGYELDIASEGSYEDLKEEIEDALIDLEFDDALEQCDQLCRAFGGAAMLMGFDDKRPLDEPLDEDRNPKLEWLNVLEPMELAPVQLYSDPSKRKYGKPEYFELTPMEVGTAMVGATPRKVRPPKRGRNLIHESRLMVFEGLKVSRYHYPISDISPFWGSSHAPRFYESLRDFAVGCAGLGVLATDSAQPVISVEGLKEKVGKDERALRDRFAAIELSRSIARAILLDSKNEKYERQTTNLAGIPEIWDRLALKFCIDADIPLSVALGYSPASLGQPGEQEQKLWHKILRRMQRRRLGPRVRYAIKRVMKSLRQRGLPKKYTVDWRALEFLTAPQQAELELTQARADTLQVKNGAIYSNEIRMSRWKGGWSQKTQIDEKKKAPGFIAPVPAGVLPGSTPGGGKPGAPAPQGPNAHSVTSYARRNPTQTTATPKVGGDSAPEGQRDGEDQAVDTVTFAGFQVAIENPRGSFRHWVDSDGVAGKTKMRHDYGYIVGSLAEDGEDVDVYLGPSESAQWVYVVHQMSKRANFEVRDEDKVMLGFDSANHARDAYLNQYDDERFFGGMSIMSLEDFRLKVTSMSGMRIAHAQLDESAIVEHLDRIQERDGKWVVLAEDHATILAQVDSEELAIARLARLEMFKAQRDAIARLASV